MDLLFFPNRQQYFHEPVHVCAFGISAVSVSVEIYSQKQIFLTATREKEDNAHHTARDDLAAQQMLFMQGAHFITAHGDQT